MTAEKKISETPEWELAIRRFVRLLSEAYGERLRGLFLYGSRARGDAAEDSDVDLLVVLADFEDFWKEFHRISSMAYASSFDAGLKVLLSAFPIQEKAFQKGASPLILNVRREGVKVA